MASKTKKNQRAQNRKVNANKKRQLKGPKSKAKKLRATASQKHGKAKQAEESGTGPKSQSSRTASTLDRMTKSMSRAMSKRELDKIAKKARSTAGIGGSRGRKSHWGKKISKAYSKRKSQLDKKLARARAKSGKGKGKANRIVGRSHKRNKR